MMHHARLLCFTNIITFDFLNEDHTQSLIDLETSAFPHVSEHRPWMVFIERERAYVMMMTKSSSEGFVVFVEIIIKA